MQILVIFSSLMAVATAHLNATARIVYNDSKQHLRDDWVAATSAPMSLRGTHAVSLHTLVFCVKQNNISKLKHMLDAISDPQSPTYREFLTFDEIGSFINTNPDAVVKWLTASGATIVNVTPRGEYITVRAPLSLWNSILATDFRLLHHTSGALIARCEKYSLPSYIAQYVHSVAYTSQLPPRMSGAPLRKKNGFTAAVTGTTTLAILRDYYHIDTPSGEEMAGNQSVFESLGQYFSPSDLESFASANNYSSPAITDINGHRSSTECDSDANACGEANLDVQYITAVGQGVPTTYWYISESDDLYYEYLVAVAKDRHPVLVHSISYGSLERELEPSILENFDTEMAKLGLLGVTVIVASGDDGVANFRARSGKSYCGYNPSYPASSPYVTAVGATMGIETGTAEIACTSKTGGTITTGGGFSTHYAQPSYQSKVVDTYFATVSTTAAPGFDRSKRGYPDIAMAGHNYAVTVGGQSSAESGTSASAPVFAAMVALVNSERLISGRSPLGFLNPTLYSFASTSMFNDITSGENNCAAQGEICCKEGFHASKGWDPLTGLGSVDFAVFRGKTIQ